MHEQALAAATNGPGRGILGGLFGIFGSIEPTAHVLTPKPIDTSLYTTADELGADPAAGREGLSKLESLSSSDGGSTNNRTLEQARSALPSGATVMYNIAQ